MVYTEEEMAFAREAEKKFFYKDKKRTLTIEDKIRMVVESIPQMEKPQDRDGYMWIPIYDADKNVFAWEEVQDPYYTPTADGSYIHPFDYMDGMSVTEGLWYMTESGDVWECIKSGTDSRMDTEWFDIIGG